MSWASLRYSSSLLDLYFASMGGFDRTAIRHPGVASIHKAGGHQAVDSETISAGSMEVHFKASGGTANLQSLARAFTPRVSFLSITLRYGDYQHLRSRHGCANRGNIDRRIPVVHHRLVANCVLGGFGNSEPVAPL